MTEAPQRLRGRLVSGSSWGLASTGLRTALGFIAVPLTLSYLGNERMGLWRLAASVLAIVSMLDAGLVPHLKTRMAAAFAKGDRNTFNVYSSTSMFFALCLLALGLVAIVVAPLVPWQWLLNVKESVAVSETLPLVMVMLGCSFSQFASNFILSVCDARMDVTRPRVYATAASVAGFGMLLVGIRLRVSLPWLAFLTASPNVLARLPLLWRLLREDVAMVRPRLAAVLPVLGEVLAAGALSISIQLLNTVLSSAPNFLVGWYLGLADVTTFSVSYQLASIPLAAIGAVVPVFWPAFTMAWTHGQKHRLRRWMVLSVCGTAGALGIYAVGLATLGVWFISVWTHGRVQADWVVLAVLGAFVVVQGCLNWLSTFMWSIGALWIQLLTQLAACALLVLICLFWLPAGGMLAIAVALLVAVVVGTLVPMLARMVYELRDKPGDGRLPQGPQAGNSAALESCEPAPPGGTQ
jgi:O-antigen/teichoic acid export membrane protein